MLFEPSGGLSPLKIMLLKIKIDFTISKVQCVFYELGVTLYLKPCDDIT